LPVIKNGKNILRDVKHDLYRIAVIGPESSGKSTLCSALAEYYNTVWVPEFAREYIAGLKRNYTKEDVIYCAKQQAASEAEAEKHADKILFIDTDFIVFKVWLVDKYKECPEWILKAASEKRYDIHLLTKPDLPFMEDPVRENPLRREYFFEWYKDELFKNNFPFEIIEGSGELRIKTALKIIDRLRSE
jgi:NadR type nicotinamide-nucleotide adenylyltransferase